MKQYITIDIGGTSIKLARFNGRSMLGQLIIPSLAEGLLRTRIPFIEEAIEKLLAGAVPDGIGMSFPGIVDTRNKRVLTTPGKFKDAPLIDLPNWALERYNCNFLVENDANAALFGECRAGCASGVDNAVMFILGTGIGTAAMMAGHLVHGVHYQAGILGGHIQLDDSGSLCICGKSGCIEAKAGTWSLSARARAKPAFSYSLLAGMATIDYQALVSAYQHGDEVAAELLDESIEVWARGIAALVHAYDPEVVVLSGGVMKGGAAFIGQLQDLVSHKAWTPWGKLDFRIPAEPDNSVLLGLHALLEEAQR
jgi:glucokinase